MIRDDRIENFFKKGQMVLDDMRKLIRPDLWPFIDQANFYYQKMEDYLKKNETKGFHYLEKHLEEVLEAFFKKLLFNLNSLKSSALTLDGPLDFKFWDQFFSLKFEFEDLFNLFHECDCINVHVRESEIIIKTDLSVINGVGPKDILRIVSSFSSKGILLTAKFEGDTILWSLRFLAKEKAFYAFDGFDKSIKFALPRETLSYLINYPEAEKINETICFEVNLQLELCKHKKIPIFYLEELRNKANNITIFHFPFLFNSISLIIPSRGSVINLNQKMGDFVTGSELFTSTTEFYSTEFNQDVAPLYFLDLFNLFKTI